MLSPVYGNNLLVLSGTCWCCRCYSRCGTIFLGLHLFRILLCFTKMFVPCNFFCLVHMLCLPFLRSEQYVLTGRATLFFWFVCTLEINFGQLVCLVAAVEVLVIIAQFVIVLATIIAHHAVLDIGTNGVATTM